MPARFVLLEIASTITMAAMFWTGFSIIIAIVIITAVVTWVQRLVFTKLVPLAIRTRKNHERLRYIPPG